MSLTAEQLALRRARIGASEIGSVLGIDRYRTPLQLWMQKKMPREEAQEDHRSWGLDVEPAILRNFARRQGYELLPPPGSLAHPTLPLVATPDALAVRHNRVRDLQAKNVEEHHVREWGEPGTADAPLYYVAQITVELGVLRAVHIEHDVEDEGDIAASFGGRPPLGYPIPFNPEVFGLLAEAAEKFVRDYLLTDKPPPLQGDRAALEYVKRRFAATTGEVKPPTPEAQDLAARLRALKADAASTEGQIEEVQAQLCALIGDAYGIDGLCTWGAVKEQRKLVTDWPMAVEALTARFSLNRTEVLETLKAHTREQVVKNSYRQLRLAKERNGKT